MPTIAKPAPRFEVNAELRETTFDRTLCDPRPDPIWRTYETVGFHVKFPDGHGSYFTPDEYDKWWTENQAEVLASVKGS